ncbi:hypothetical protein NW759_003526 [Fusarium solani]|uniref:Fungal-specific transcription factor domain-containing protein n=1 Tax=Fusarium solani TaxID=169388 RepID=A0A9P9RB70_FUSSL|nr:fungal-specific transcription factor domain-containing protein [Fusarium solani]KAH7272557.1 fungal-specific transcription factor domain-containing protein [Fusarium solani]KAJ4230169.1 hypothetical protein NW759_003526 [Fusarium solani]
MSPERPAEHRHPEPASNDSRQPRTGPARRRTNGRACIVCHQRKVRCDILEKGIPCSNCQSQDRSNCRLYEKKKTRSTLARINRPTNIPLQPRHRGQQPVTAPATPTPTPQWPGISTDGSTDPIPRPSSSSADNRARYHHNDSPSTIHGSAAGNCEDEQATRNLAEFIDQDEVRVGEITRAARLYYIGTEFSNLNYLVRQRARQPDQNVVHFGSHPLARKIPSVPQEALQLPPKALADELVRAYFTHVNRGFPVVDEEEFMARYNGTDAYRQISLPLFHAVCLVGAHVLSSRREDVKAIKFDFFRRAKLLFDCRFEQHRESYLQVALLLTWQCDNLEDIVSNSWHWVGVAARTAMGMGMHRDAAPSSLNTMDKSQWVRLWWSVFQFDVMVSASYGRPQAINLDESDAPMLHEKHFDGIPHANCAFAIQHTQLCIIFSKAMKGRVAIRASPADRAQVTKQADEELAQFITQLPESLRLSFPEPDIWQATLHLSYNNFLILLHRPPPRQDPKHFSPDTATDMSICGDAVAAINSIFESLRSRDLLCDLWLPAVHVLFTALLHVASELNSANPLVAAKSLRMFDCLLVTLRELSRHWLYAESLLRLFEERTMWNRPRANLDGSAEASVARGPQRSNEGPQNDGPERFSLRPDPLATSSGIPQSPAGGIAATGFQTSSRAPGLGHREQLPGQGLPHGQAGPPYAFNYDFGGAMAGQGAGNTSRDIAQGVIPYSDGFIDNGMDMAESGQGLDLLPVPSALEFLLAGMDGEYDF